ncbi:MAG: CHAT domain-containing protein [Cyanobacteria bacterium J06626_18]
MTQEFHLSITSLGSDRYLIRTEDTAAGVPVAETQVEWPVDDWLQQAKPHMDDPIIGLLKGEANLNNGASGFHTLGETLYNALFHEGAIRESWLRAQGIAQNREEMLRLRLGLKESRLQRLPWEVLHHDGHPLTTRYDMTFTRYAANFLVGQTLEIDNFLRTDSSLRVLMVIASPGDQDHLKLLHEAKHIKEVLGAANEATPPVDITVLEQPDRNTLAQALEQGNYQVLHYAGHSDFGDSGGDLSLVNRQTGLTERLSGDDLAGLLVNNQVVLTVFNSCRSAHTAGDDAEMDWRQQNLVQALVNRGVPSVIAMAERIPDEVAIAFTQLFYKNLRKGYPIDLSLSRTRQGLIAAFGSDQYYWALPILYLQPDFDGYMMGDDHTTENELPTAAPELPEAAPQSPGESAPNRTPHNNGAVDFLAELENTSPADDDEEAVANFVKQLSETSTATDEPPMPAAQEEDLVDTPSERTGMAIYDTLPEVPLKATPDTESPESDGRSQPSQNGKRPTTRQQPQRQPQQLPTTQPQRPSEKSPLIWFALGLVGLFAVFGLGALALRWANRSPEPTPTAATEQPAPEVEPVGSPEANVLISEAQQAIEQERYADARNDFEQALVQEAVGNTEPNAATDAILALIGDVQQPDFDYIRGRLTWQQLARIGEDELSVETESQKRGLVLRARDSWENVDNDFLKGRVAQGFAHYAAGDLTGAIESWEAADRLYENQRQQQQNPADATPADPLILHVYAGLTMAHWELANLNLEALEAEDLATLSESERATLQTEADRERAIAGDYFAQLQTLDASDRMSPQALQTINEAPETWDNWLWTDDLLRDWGSVRREFGGEEG